MKRVVPLIIAMVVCVTFLLWLLPSAPLASHRTRSTISAKSPPGRLRLLETASKLPEPDVMDFQKNTNSWLKAFEIWACDDGTFEVKTPLTLRAKVATLEQAKLERYLWAEEMAAKAKAGLLGFSTSALPTCGKKVNLTP